MAARVASRSVTILGASGSVGASTASVIESINEREPGAIEVAAIAGGANASHLAAMARRLKPRFVAIADVTQLGTLRSLLAGEGCEIAGGPDAVIEAADRPSDWVMSAITGAAGLAPTLAAVRRGTVIALANKETMVCAGPLVNAAAAAAGATILPVDSEHNAMFQVMTHPDRVERLILTATGGPFRNKSRAEMAGVTADDACRHPRWSMGRKISIDSATLMNKGLELIEASYLFAMPEDRIDVLVHPEAIVHSLVSYCDGSVLAQMSEPDMRVPIAHTLAWPDRVVTAAARLDLVKHGALTFHAPDLERFPALRLAREALRLGGAAPAALNGANETAVAAFLEGRIGFLQIAEIVERVLEGWNADEGGTITNSPSSFDDVARIDRVARAAAGSCAARLGR